MESTIRDWRSIGCAAALGLVTLVAPPAGARIGVISPVGEDGIPLEYPDELPEDSGEVLPLTWSFVVEQVPLVVAGATLDRECPSGISPVIDDVVDEALKLMTGLDAEAAVDLLDELQDDLPCLDEPVTSPELADIYYYRAAALAFLGEDESARWSMRSAVAIEPSLSPDQNLPGKINTWLKEEQARGRDVVSVRLRVPIEMTVRIDGQGEEPELAVDGLGLIQWEDARGRWSSALLRDVGDSVVVSTVEGVQERLQHRDDPMVLPLAAALGEALYHPMRIDQALLWDGGDGVVLWDSLEREARWFEETPRVRGGGSSRDGSKGDRDDHFRFVLVGGVAHFDSFPYATAGADCTILLYGRLALALGADAAFPLTEFQERRTVPIFHSGLRLRLGPLAIKAHPFLGLAFRGGIKEEHAGKPTAMLGGSATVGVDLRPMKHMVIRIAVDGGFLDQRGLVHARIGFGFGI